MSVLNEWDIHIIFGTKTEVLKFMLPHISTTKSFQFHVVHLTQKRLNAKVKYIEQEISNEQTTCQCEISALIELVFVTALVCNFTHVYEELLPHSCLCRITWKTMR